MQGHDSRRPRLMIVAAGVFLSLVLTVLPALGQSPPRVSRVGLSRVQNTSMLTVLLSREVTPQVSPVLERGAPRLLVDFPDTQPDRLPDQMAGDQELIQQVRIQNIPGRPGVRIVLEFIPGRSYVFWRQVRPGPGGSSRFILGLREEGQAPVAPPGLETGDRQAPAPPTGRRPDDQEPAAERPGRRPERRVVGEIGRPETAPFIEMANIIPAAAGVLRHLEKTGWQLEGQGVADRSGNQHYVLSNAHYPDLSVKIRHMPGRGGAPPINFLTLGADRLSGSEADKYRRMRSWSMGEIRKHFEDIGDYYDDGLKPLRIILRERTKAVALRQYDVFRQFLEAAVPQDPQLADTILKHIQEKTNKRLEGAQYTVSENPLVLLNQVDFLYVRVYFVGS